jgi:hypothetical protein
LAVGLTGMPIVDWYNSNSTYLANSNYLGHVIEIIFVETYFSVEWVCMQYANVMDKYMLC